MRKAIAMGCMTVASLLGLGTAALGQECKPEVVVATGAAAFTRTGAEANAISAWRREVVSRYGEFFADFESAGGHDVSRCADTMVWGMRRCEARGRPCMTAGSIKPIGEVAAIPPTSCTSSDSPRCNPHVKTIQLKLNQRGCRTKVDGVALEGTELAVKCFQKKAGLEQTGKIDQRTGSALMK